jgi:hypothetical protein
MRLRRGGHLVHRKVWIARHSARRPSGPTRSAARSTARTREEDASLTSHRAGSRRTLFVLDELDGRDASAWPRSPSFTPPTGDAAPGQHAVPRTQPPASLPRSLAWRGAFSPSCSSARGRTPSPWAALPTESTSLPAAGTLSSTTSPRSSRPVAAWRLDEADRLTLTSAPRISANGEPVPSTLDWRLAAIVRWEA